MRPRLLVPIVCAAALAAVPASALGATATVTEEGGQPQALPATGGPTIRDLGPTVGATFDPATEKRYSIAITGPGGQPAAAPSNCFNTSSAPAKQVDYQGNGAYTVIVRTFSADNDLSCTGQPAEHRFSFTIAGGVALQAPAPRLLSRRAGTFQTLQHPFAVDRNTGADRHEIRFARNGRVGPDGGISGASTEVFLPSDSSIAAIRFPAPGRYVVVGRAGEFTSGGSTTFTPWSAPVYVDVLAPFDLSYFGYPDQRGPSYQLRGIVREKSVAGKRVRIALGRGSKGRFRSIGRPKIGRNGEFNLRFRVTQTGRYRIRVRFLGSKSVAPGQYTAVVTIRARRS